MAKTVLSIGTSQSPLLLLDGEHWEVQSADDRRKPRVKTLNGRPISHEQLVAERGEPCVERSRRKLFP